MFVSVMSLPVCFAALVGGLVEAVLAVVHGVVQGVSSAVGLPVVPWAPVLAEAPVVDVLPLVGGGRRSSIDDCSSKEECHRRHRQTEQLHPPKSSISE